MTSAVPPPDLVDALRAAGCVWAEDEAAILVDASPADEDARWRLAERRMAGEPLEQVVGWASFCGRRILLEPGVFVPRRRTEPLAHAAVRAARDRGPSPLVVDLCCGSGALAVVVAGEIPGARVHAADVDPVATRCAARNLAGAGRVHTGDLFDALPHEVREHIDVLVVNAPYVPTGRLPTLPAEARLHEPRLALDGGADGVDVHRQVAAQARGWLAVDGVVLIETSAEQAESTVAALADGGLAVDTVHSGGLDGDADLDGMVVARGRR